MGQATGTATITVTITGVNDAPTVETKANDIALQDTEKAADDAHFLVPADGGGYEATEGSSIGLAFDDVDDSSLTLTASGLQAGWSFTSNGSIAGTAALSNPLKAEKHTVTVTAKDDGDADNSNPLSASDTLDIYIGLNNSANDSNIGPGQSYTIEGSDFADDSIDTGFNHFGSGNNVVNIDLGNGTNYFKTEFIAAKGGGEINYQGGDGSDEVRFLQFAALNGGKISVEAGDGDNILYLGNYAARGAGSISYQGGTGTDEIEVNYFLAFSEGEVTLDLGSDISSDLINFNGSVANARGVVTIQNFDPVAEDSMLFKFDQGGNTESALLTDLLVEVDSANSSNVIIRSPDVVAIDSDKYVYLIVENANVADFDLSIDSNGDLLIN